MQQDAFSYLLLSGPLCGIIMVLGGILLLYKGAITLSGATEDALSVEFRKELRITTQYPALGIFVIGLMFVAIPALLGKPPETQPFTVKGTAIGVDEPISVQLVAGGWSKNLKHTGQILETHHPYIDTLQIVITAPGYQPHKETVQLSELNNGTADLGEFELKQELSRRKVSAQISNIPDHISLEGLSSGGSFGVVQ